MTSKIIVADIPLHLVQHEPWSVTCHPRPCNKDCVGFWKTKRRAACDHILYWIISTWIFAERRPRKNWNPVFFWIRQTSNVVY
jgi:hypothetical protein